MSIKLALIFFAMSPDFVQTDNIVREFERPAECNAMYIDRLSKQSLGDVRYQDGEYGCRYIVDDKIMSPSYVPPGVVAGTINVVRPPIIDRAPDFILRIE